MKVKLDTINPDDILYYISKTEYAGLITYDKEQKKLVPVVGGLYVYFDPLHGVLEIKEESMSNKKVNEISDEQLLKCMKEYLDNPTKYYPEYLQILTSDYERRVKERIVLHGGPKNQIPDFKHTPLPPPERTTVVSTLTNVTI